jgi:hypothetical protein
VTADEWMDVQKPALEANAASIIPVSGLSLAPPTSCGRPSKINSMNQSGGLLVTD